MPPEKSFPNEPESFITDCGAKQAILSLGFICDLTDNMLKTDIYHIFTSNSAQSQQWDTPLQQHYSVTSQREQTFIPGCHSLLASSEYLWASSTALANQRRQLCRASRSSSAAGQRSVMLSQGDLQLQARRSWQVTCLGKTGSDTRLYRWVLFQIPPPESRDQEGLEKCLGWAQRPHGHRFPEAHTSRLTVRAFSSLRRSGPVSFHIQGLFA